MLDLVGSTLSDPYISYAAALYALAGPLHGFVYALSEQNVVTNVHLGLLTRRCSGGS
jgi:hypothetical protein